MTGAWPLKYVFSLDYNLCVVVVVVVTGVIYNVYNIDLKLDLFNLKDINKRSCLTDSNNIPDLFIYKPYRCTGSRLMLLPQYRKLL